MQVLRLLRCTHDTTPTECFVQRVHVHRSSARMQDLDNVSDRLYVVRSLSELVRQLGGHTPQHHREWSPARRWRAVCMHGRVYMLDEAGMDARCVADTQARLPQIAGVDATAMFVNPTLRML